MPRKRDPDHFVPPAKRKGGYIQTSKKRNAKQGISLAPVRQYTSDQVFDGKRPLSSARIAQLRALTQGKK